MDLYSKYLGWLVGFGLGFLLILMLVVIGLTILWIASLWVLYRKAGVPGWGAIIPFYNMYLMYKIVWGSGWWFLTMLIPIGGVVILYITYFKLAKCFGKGTGYGVGMIFIPLILTAVLAFGGSRYMGPRPGGKAGSIVAAVVVAIVWVFLVVLGAMVEGRGVLSKVFDENGFHYSIEWNWGDEDEYSGEADSLDEFITVTGSSSSEDSEEVVGSALNPTDFNYLTLSNGEVNIDVPYVNTEISYTGMSYIFWCEEGLTVSSELNYLDDISVEQDASEVVENFKTLYTDSLGITEFQESDMLTQEGLAVKLVQFTDNTDEENPVTYLDVVKVEDVDGYNLVTEITIDTGSTEETLITNTLNAYGISIN